MLEDLKSLLGLTEETDEALDKRLNLILSGTKSRLKSLLGGIEPPEELNYIILEVSVIRYNRIGSEGLSAHTVEGESQSFSADDFSGYRDDIQDFLDRQQDTSKGKVRFL